MRHLLLGLISYLCLPLGAHAQTFVLLTNSSDYSIDTVFSEVNQFDFRLEIAAPLAPGVYENPIINRITYSVMGVLAPGTPSGFEAFGLERDISGSEFYQQGSTLRFEIAASAILDDGVQLNELVADSEGNLLVLNAREVGNGRFHPALFELRSDGTGRIQNSNNVPTQDPLLEISAGDEYITDLRFELDNTTLLSLPRARSSGGTVSGLMAFNLLIVLLSFFLKRTLYKRF